MFVNRLMGSLFALFAFSLSADFQEEWVVDKGQKNEWEALFDQHGIPLDYLQQVLPTYGLSVAFGEPGSVEEVSLLSRPVVKAPTLLWENEEVGIYYPAQPRVRHHLSIVLKRPVESFLDLTSDEIVQLKGVENSIQKLLHSQFGLSSVIAQWNEPQAGGFTIEILPGQSDSKGVLNVLDKVDSNNHVLFRDRFPAALSAPTDEEKHSDIAFWQGALSRTSLGTFSERLAADSIADWTQVQTNRIAADKQLMAHCYQILRENNLLIERTDVPNAVDHPVVSEKSGCSLCLEKVLKAQKIHESELSYILYNYKSAIPGSHFLIVPKRHVRSCADLRKEEVRDMQELAQKLTKALQEERGRSDINMYIQDGPDVGQTVPHVNMHVLLTPSPLNYMLFSLNYDAEETWTRDRMMPLLQGVVDRLNKVDF